MSLLVRLLTTGRSLVNLKDPNGQYRFRRKNRLPKFGSKENPFSAKGDGKSLAPLPVQTELLQAEPTPVEPETADLQPPAALPSSPAPAPAPAAPEKSKPKSPGLFVRWFGKLNPLAWWSSRKRVKSVIPRFQRAPVQGELSLDNVKVVRNDLSEPDVEIVPAKPATRKPWAAGRADAGSEAGSETQSDEKSELAGIRPG